MSPRWASSRAGIMRSSDVPAPAPMRTACFDPIPRASLFFLFGPPPIDRSVETGQIVMEQAYTEVSTKISDPGRTELMASGVPLASKATSDAAEVKSKTVTARTLDGLTLHPEAARPLLDVR